jgi:hypothetical protein
MEVPTTTPSRTDAMMAYSTHLALTLSTLGPAVADLGPPLHDPLGRFRAVVEREVLAFLGQPVTPTALLELENRLATGLRELGRELVEWACNRLEGDDPSALPSHLRSEGTEYRLVRTKTRQPVDTRFGPMALWRHLYRPADRHSPEPAFAPLARALGIVANTTPALAEAAGRYLAEAGATQQVVRDRLHTHHGVSIGTGRLRALGAHLSGHMSGVRQGLQVATVVDLLGRADRSSGGRKPVLSVGRDGITLREYRHRLYEVASCATVTVLDRAGNRLGTVYLGFVPEHGQGRMSDHLTALIEAVLGAWTGPVPRLAYVTDAGDNETGYYRRVLRAMTHPRTGARLEWHRVVDFYHAMERVWAMAGALFGDGTTGARGWARRMGGLLKKPNGPFRVLHAAAAARAGRALTPTAKKAYEAAYRYIRARTQWMRYHEYKKHHVPLGSGITEAACKTIFTQRLKRSGMRWTKAGAQVILDLRVVLLSGIWDPAYRHVLTTCQQPQLPTPPRELEIPTQMAA